jgi:hypothetical protein
MNHRVISLILSLVSLTGILLGYVLLWHPGYLGICPVGIDCISNYVLFGVAKPLFWSTRSLPPFFLLLALVPKNVFVTWKKFGIWSGIVALILILATDPINSGFAGGFFPDRTQMTLFATEVFVVLNLLFIMLKYIQLKRTG